MSHRRAGIVSVHLLVAVVFLCWGMATRAVAHGDWEITQEGEHALARGLQWLAANQGTEGNWESEDLGLVSMGALAFLSAGHLPDRGVYGKNVQRALDYVVRHERSNGLLNIAEPGHDMYNHGLSAFVLGQAYGMTGDARIGPVLDRALKLIAESQCGDGGWEYQARRSARGHDLSLAVMQAKALRSAVDSGLEVSPQVIELAVRGVRRFYTPQGCSNTDSEEAQKQHPGQFTYQAGGGRGTLAMAAAGVVCLQEFAQYDDWRIEKNMTVICGEVRQKLQPSKRGGTNAFFPFDAYTLYYVGQALYQVGGGPWKECYPVLRDALIRCQAGDGSFNGSGRVKGRKPAQLYFTSSACFVLAIPNRYLPILQEGRIDSLREKFRSPK